VKPCPRLRTASCARGGTAVFPQRKWDRPVRISVPVAKVEGASQLIQALAPVTWVPTPYTTVIVMVVVQVHKHEHKLGDR